MTLQVAFPMSYLHERYFGQPSCPNCGEIVMASEHPSSSASVAMKFGTFGRVTDATIELWSSSMQPVLDGVRSPTQGRLMSAVLR